jgi:hypothetical protein
MEDTLEFRISVHKKRNPAFSQDSSGEGLLKKERASSKKYTLDIPNLTGWIMVLLMH